MSHLSVVKTKVSRFQREVLLDVLKSLERDWEIEIVKEAIVKDAYVQISAPIIIRHKRSGRYIGFNPTTGEILYDPFGWRDLSSKIINAVLQRYIAVVMVKKLQTMGYNVKVQQTEKAIIGMGVKA
jgi:hypothetical protein